MKFDMMVWYSEEEYGKAWTTIEANSEEEARAIFNKAFDEGKEYEFDWDCQAKGGSYSFDRETEIYSKERKETPDNE